MSPDSLRIGSAEEGATFEVRLTPRSSRQGVGGLRDGAVELKVNAPPVEGRANDAARKLLAAALGVSRSSIRLVTGVKSRRKVFSVVGLSPGELRSRLNVLIKKS